MMQHTGMAGHDGYAAHSHEARPDHLGVPRFEDATLLRMKLRQLGHDDLVAILMALCSGMYPRAAADSVLAELGKHRP